MLRRLYSFSLLNSEIVWGSDEGIGKFVGKTADPFRTAPDGDRALCRVALSDGAVRYLGRNSGLNPHARPSRVRFVRTE